MASIFTKIIQGELPAFKIYEDDLTIAILTLDQVNPGHCLVIPKEEVDHWFQCEDPAYTRVHAVARKLAPAIQKATGCKRVGQAVLGFEVPHYHLHLIPLENIQELDFRRAKRLSQDEMARLQREIKQHLE